MSDANAALIALVGVLAGGYINNFLGDDYKRYREGQALAGALAGELKSHGTAVPEIRRQLESMLSYLQSPSSTLDFTENEFNPPNSPVFDAGVAKLGLLGPALAEDVAYVYEQIRAFRITFSRVIKIASKASREQTTFTLNYCLTCLNRADERGQKLVVDLQTFAKAGYWRSRPWLGLDKIPG